VAALDDNSIAASNHIGIVPFGDGYCALKHDGTNATITEHYLSGRKTEIQTTFINQLTLALQQSRGDEVLEWIEIVLTKR
jgi:phage-related protein